MSGDGSLRDIYIFKTDAAVWAGTIAGLLTSNFTVEPRGGVGPRGVAKFITDTADDEIQADDMGFIGQRLLARNKG